jgi:hypothetical protein
MDKILKRSRNYLLVSLLMINSNIYAQVGNIYDGSRGRTVHDELREAVIGSSEARQAERNATGIHRDASPWFQDRALEGARREDDRRNSTTNFMNNLGRESNSSSNTNTSSDGNSNRNSRSGGFSSGGNNYIPTRTPYAPTTTTTASPVVVPKSTPTPQPNMYNHQEFEAQTRKNQNDFRTANPSNTSAQSGFRTTNSSTSSAQSSFRATNSPTASAQRSFRTMNTSTPTPSRVNTATASLANNVNTNTSTSNAIVEKYNQHNTRQSFVQKIQAVNQEAVYSIPSTSIDRNTDRNTRLMDGVTLPNNSQSYLWEKMVEAYQELELSTKALDFFKKTGVDISSTLTKGSGFLDGVQKHGVILLSLKELYENRINDFKNAAHQFVNNGFHLTPNEGNRLIHRGTSEGSKTSQEGIRTMMN